MTTVLIEEMNKEGIKVRIQADTWEGNTMYEVIVSIGGVEQDEAWKDYDYLSGALIYAQDIFECLCIEFEVSTRILI